MYDYGGASFPQRAAALLGHRVHGSSRHCQRADTEYPHYAFFIEPDDFLPMVAWLRQNGVTTSEPWTRDPAGNLFEMYCPKLNEAASFVRGAKQGGSYIMDFASLNYRWNG